VSTASEATPAAGRGETDVGDAAAGLTGTAAATEPFERVARAFKAAMAAVRRLRGRETHLAGELSYAQYSLLFSLASEGQVSVRDLAQAADLTPATVTQMLDALEVAGLVRRTRAEDDRRVVLTALTERGVQLVGERRARYEPRLRAALAQFSDGELLTAAAVLEALAAHFKALGE
jgi:DNA-binding MarR family transcriptional regulator